MYVLVSDNSVQVVYDLKKVLNGHSLSSNPNEKLLAEFGIFPLKQKPYKTPSPTQRVIEVEPEQIDGEWVQNFVLEELEGEERLNAVQHYREQLEQRIKDQAAELYSQPVLFNDIEWRGGVSSATAIKNATDLVQFAGGTTIVLRDANRAPHEVPLSEALQIAATIGAKYQEIFQLEEDALHRLSLIDLASETAIQQIEAVTL